MIEHGLNMDRQLLISAIIEHAAAQYGSQIVSSRETHGPIHRYTYRECARRSRRLAQALRRLGLQPGDFAATLAWNNHRHLEAYFAVSGSGLAIHTCNPRLHLDQLAYVLDHAGDTALLFDATFAPLVAALAPRCPRIRHWIALCERAHMPPLEGLPGLLCYEELIAPETGQYAWPDLDERTAAALCYTSGTTGHPKGALYTHRALILNALTVTTPGILSLAAEDSVLPIVPMFHINAWCIPYAAPIAGSALVLPGPRLDGAALYEMMESERVTRSAGVPTVLLGLLQHVESHELELSTLRRICSGGSLVPASLIAKYAERGIELLQGWGMTETSGVATMTCLTADEAGGPQAERCGLTAKQGRTPFGVEIKVVDEDGRTLPRDGTSQGELMIRGQWIVSGYYKSETSPIVDGWLRTGDVATIDANGILQIRDRIKDLIKTGGEWISSIDVENVACNHPSVAQAAVIGVRHPKWQERPLLFVVRRPGHELARQQILDHLGAQLARICVPEEVIFLEALPVGGTGKVQKAALRAEYGDVFQ
ncbi:MAG TPA: long-chain-fatty-acid--CoA ligase [Steroidobacteraceae bacterium]|nr:long-chain-fatty-acid--CoA ligase [Steroidobacteraceae bacterium]